ncbi:hypothetical protein GE21DRAFT_5417 [Neurospora crassa]|uniref:Zn(2)-C6 fungal-type domain-containing protein n=1 Tax=Neurospora crassa (strain ATCC 24698 / 74-OR23-1A / CBS 708.71 / DSM 1257 / FGSC 987) TaxID=367110 RepID=Q7S3Q7_NEUCR|nr:hypothetical protein NCU04960 [Neurospora crassa OR74A]EAA30172.1 hypothetical protein NCU04960 [Neurospora crassa OR74A]KHE81578.1 hypothetical protein GE21DRAFT_5417 [Neurospora crassa]|eukprot:XP_959408.1 hypothetical protein NCU04960 [Neurospora crassa OR74A]
MEQPQVKIIGGREYAATGSKFGPSYLPVDVMARMNNSAHQGLAMSAVVHDKRSLNSEAPAREPLSGVDTRKHLTMPSPERGPVASTFRPLPKIPKANDQGSVNSFVLPIRMANNPMEAAMVCFFNSVTDSSRTRFEDLLANMVGQTSTTVNSGSDSSTANNGNGDGSGDGAASSSATTTTTTAADTTSTNSSNIGTPRRRRAAGGGSGGSGRKPGGTPRKKPASRADVIEKRGSCERCKKSKAKCEPIPECIRCAKDGVECSLKETIMQETGRRLGACQRCKKNKVGCKKIESCGRCHKAEQPCSWAVKA